MALHGAVRHREGCEGSEAIHGLGARENVSCRAFQRAASKACLLGVLLTSSQSGPVGGCKALYRALGFGSHGLACMELSAVLGVLLVLPVALSDVSRIALLPS